MAIITRWRSPPESWWGNPQALTGIADTHPVKTGQDLGAGGLPAHPRCSDKTS
jgi:hypothetical protein